MPQASSDIILTFSKMILVALTLTLVGSIWFLDRARLRHSLPTSALIFFLLYLVSSFLSNTVFSSMPSYTLLGYKNWSTGYYFSALCILLLIISTLRYDKRRIVGFTYKPFFFMTLVLLFICISEILGFNVLLGSSWFRFNGEPLSLSKTSYPIAGVGNSGLLAGVWLLLAPLPLLVVKKNKIVYYLWTLCIAIGLGSCHSKSTLLIYSIFVIIQGAYFLKSKNFILIFWCILTVIVSYSSLPIFQASNIFLYKYGLVNRKNADNFNPSSKDYSLSVRNRIIIYKSTAKLIAQRPMVGWGYETLQEKFFDTLNQSDYLYFISSVMQQKEDETVKRFGNLHILVKKANPKVGISAQVFTIVKPHNTVLEEIYSNGLIGFVLLASGLAVCVAFILKRRNRVALIFLTCCSIYTVYLMFWFTTAGVTTFAAILFGLAVRISAMGTIEIGVKADDQS